MNWIDYTKYKPTDKHAQYLVYYEMRHSKGTMEGIRIANWNGEYFHKYDYEFDVDYKYTDVKYWIKIKKPNEE